MRDLIWSKLRRLIVFQLSVMPSRRRTVAYKTQAREPNGLNGVGIHVVVYLSQMNFIARRIVEIFGEDCVSKAVTR